MEILLTGLAAFAFGLWAFATIVKALIELRKYHLVKLLKKDIENYNKALSKDPGNNFANYSVGTLYYNKAAYYVKQMQSVSDDMSKAGMKKYEGFEKQMFSMFDMALPYFEKAEKGDPNDKNTLIALREIYARKNQLDKAAEYAKKIEDIK